MCANKLVVYTVQSETEPQKIIIHLNNRFASEETGGQQNAKHTPVPKQQVCARIY